ncbi:MAG: sigma-70 family RNA polymerase sigma factor [Caldilineaceae bacterium]|nr:sigma-70 family RNA polymerase sigma factor [Caldilineaceae bacterium]
MNVLASLTQQSPSSTTDLVKRCLRGDADAWTQLVNRYARLVHAVPVRHGLPPAEVDDVGQEVFLLLAQNLHQIEDPERLPGWLVTTARRVTWRLLQRRREENMPEPMIDGNEPHSTGLMVSKLPTPDELLEAWARQEMLEAGLERLQERCRTLLTLLFLDPDELSYDDISARLEIPKGSIGPTRNRCLQQLRAILEGLGHRRT